MTAPTYKFGDFQLDSSRFELRCHDRPLKLERIPMELLILLLEKNGEVVSRQEIIERLWGKDVFLDTEHGINTAIRKIRAVLREDVERPRFIQTVSGKGYRFVPDALSTNANGTAASAEILIAANPVPANEVLTPASMEAGPISTDEGLASRKWAWAIALLIVAGATLALNVAGLRDRVFAKNSIGPIHSIAVLPLSNLSGDPSQNYYADGILEGSIERTPNSVHMTVQLIYAPTDTHVWAESYDRDLNHVYSLPEELSQTIAKEVKIATSPAPAQRYISPGAHDAYLHGRYFWFTFDKMPQALPYFEKAIQLQPDYAAAWSGLADTYMVEGMNGDALPLDMMPKAEAAARKALELDDSLPEVHTTMAAWYTLCAWDLPRAEAEARRGVELGPNNSQAHLALSAVLEAENRSAEALAEQKRSAELDPFIHPWEVGRFYTDAGQYDAAIDEFRMQSRVRPDDSDMVYGLSKVYWLKGMYKESQQELERALEMQHNSKDLAAAHQAWVRGGEKAVEQWGANNFRVLARQKYIPAWEVATVVAYTGDKEETLKYLETAYREHSPNMVSLQTESLFGFLHSDPRFQALVKKVGVPPAP